MEVLPNFLIRAVYIKRVDLSWTVGQTTSLASLCSNFETFDQEHLTLSTIKLVVLFKSTMPMNTGFYI